MQMVLTTVGLSLVVCAIFMIFPAMLEGTLSGNVFLLVAFLSLFVGSSLIFTSQGKKNKFKVKDAYLMTALLWVVIPFFSALPFYFAKDAYHLDMVNALFESISCITGTGATVYVGLDSAPQGILLWRSILQWIGGVGIVSVSMTIFPYLRVGGMQLFQSESSDRSDKVFTKVRQVAQAIIVIYIVLTLGCTIAYHMAGMTVFDAVNHAMTTLSTGGISTHDASVAFFDNPDIEWIAITFMILGGSPLLLLYYVMVGKRPNRALLSQAMVFWVGLIVLSILMAIWVYIQLQTESFSQVFRHVLFTLTSTITTTGYVITDYSAWGAVAGIAIYFLTIVGGCTGSTSGGLKIFRLQVMVQMLIVSCKRLIYPNGVFQAHIGRKVLSEEVMQSVVGFFCLFIFVFSAVSILLCATGLDFITSLSAAATCLANVGPGLGTIIGPVGNFEPLNHTAKLILSFAMIAGRLEIMTLLVLCSKYYWQDYQLMPSKA